MTSPYSRIPDDSNESQRYAPRPHRWQAKVEPPPKMDKDAFDRCGNCTRGFGFLSRKKHCANCGFVYCTDCCTEKVKLVKYQGQDSRDVRVCDYCKEFLKIDRMPSQVLVTMSVRSLREYIEAYGLAKGMPFVEKTDLINTILDAEITEHNEETTPGFRDWHRKHRRETRGSRPSSSSNSNTATSGQYPRSTSTNVPRTQDTPLSPLSMAENVFRKGMEDISEIFKNVTGGYEREPQPSQRSTRRENTRSRRGSATIERERRPYVGHQDTPSSRARSASDISTEPNPLNPSPEPAPFERQRRQYASTTHLSTSPPSQSSTTYPSPPSTSQSRPPSQHKSTPSTDLRTIVNQGTDISTLPTSTLLSIIRQNGCILPPGALEKEVLIERVEEMASFIIAAPKEAKVRDDDEDDCKICFDRVADYCLVPCGHTGFCFMCARKMAECPFCKVVVAHAQKLWKV